MEADIGDVYIPSLYKSASLLPIARHRHSLLYLIETFPVTIVVGETGSGKSTQIPQYLREAGWCQDGKVVAITQVGESTSTISEALWILLYLNSHVESLRPPSPIE